MRWPVTVLLAGLLSAAGCRNCDLVEAELRTRENDLRELRAELARATCVNEALMKELGALRQAGGATPSPELASQVYPVRKIVLSRQTGGYDEDNIPGDEGLQVAVEPRDGDDHALKAPGTLHVDALEINNEGLKTFLCSWDVAPEQLRRNWKSGWLNSSYVVALPWKQWPTSDKIRVTARFQLADGRVFEADRDITIRITPTARRKPAGVVPADTMPSISPVEPTLPAPRKVDGPVETTSQKWWIPSAPSAPNPRAGGSASELTQSSIVEAIRLEKPIPVSLFPTGAVEN